MQSLQLRTDRLQYPLEEAKDNRTRAGVELKHIEPWKLVRFFMEICLKSDRHEYKK